ncbi:MAG: amidohydrolase [Candidatus Limnocylindria bacterium]
MTHADLVLVGARVEPIASLPGPADAVAVGAGRISAVGTAADVEGLVGPRTRVIRLHGETLLPGFQDAHVHPVYGGLTLRSCNLHGLPDQDAYLAAVAAYAAAYPELEWLTGDGWTYAPFPGGIPRRETLDRVVPDRPVFLTAYDGHSAWVNSQALELAKVRAETPDPEFGRIERDPDGTPLGLLSETAQRLVERLVPEPTPAELVESLLDSQRHLHALGITAWHDPGVNPEWLPAYRQLAESGRLTARVVAAQQWWPWGKAKEPDPVPRLVAQREALRIGSLRADVVKFWLDGVFENGTAAVLEPYLGTDGAATDNRGTSNYGGEELIAAVIELERNGFDCHFHAIGDAAVRQALDAVTAARAAHGPRDVRHSIAHIELIHPADIGRFAKLDVAANMQPFWAMDNQDTREILLPRLGAGRVNARYAFADLHRSGARLAGGSDWTVTTANPLEEIEVAVRRVDPGERDAEPFRPDQRLDLDTALAAFTIGSAWVNRLEADTGTIEVGKRADLVVLDRDLRAVPDGRLADAKVVTTFVEGAPVFEG